MKQVMLIWMMMMTMCGFTVIKTVLAQPNVFTIQCTGHDASFQQTDPNRIQIEPHYSVEGGVLFEITAGTGVHLKTETITWSHPPAGGGNDPSWGAWAISSGKTVLTWSPPTGASASGNFRVSVNGKFTCGNGNGGGEYNFSGYWDGDLNRDWEANPAIVAQKDFTYKIVESGQQSFSSDTPVHPGEKLKLTIKNIHDDDTHNGATPSKVADTTTPVSWSDSSSNDNDFSEPIDETDTNPDPRLNKGVYSTVTWTVPPLNKLPMGTNNEGWIEITAVIDDKAPPIGKDETGSRDDKPLKVTYLISVTGPKVWKRAEDENQATNIDAKITKPVKVEKGDTPPTINAKPGDQIKVSLEGSDVDYWTRQMPTPTSGTQTAPIGLSITTPVWTATLNGKNYGEFSEKNEDGSTKSNQSYNSTVYHIPSEAEFGTEIIITAHADDHNPNNLGDAVPADDSGKRDDDPVDLSFKIKISKDPDIQSIELTPEKPITSGYQNNPAASLDFKADISDPESKVKSVTWSWDNQSFTGNPWHIDAVPYDSDHGDNSVTCTIHWDDNGTPKSKSKSKDFKLFFDHDGHDESNDSSLGANGINPPNWFDDTAKHWGDVMDNKISGLNALKSAHRFFYSNSIGGTDHSGEVPIQITNSYHVPVGSVVIAPAAGGSISPQPGYVYTARTSGIDSFGAIILHEMRHRWQLQQSWGIADGDSEQTLESKIGPNGTWIFDGTTYDKDADGMRDSWEEIPVAQGGWGQIHNQPDKFLLNKRYDGNTFEQDDEFDADMNGARTWAIGSADGQDWANTGKQSEQG